MIYQVIALFVYLLHDILLLYELSSSQIVYVIVAYGINIYEFSSSQIVYVNVTYGIIIIYQF
jgi:hypothetical protein